MWSSWKEDIVNYGIKLPIKIAFAIGFMWVLIQIGWKGLLLFFGGMALMAYLLLSTGRLALFLQSLLKYSEGSLYDEQQKSFKFSPSKEGQNDENKTKEGNKEEGHKEN